MKYRKDAYEGGRGFARHARHGAPFIGSVLNATGGYMLAEAKQHPRDDLLDGMAFTIDGAPWRYSESSTLTGDDVLVATLSETPTGRLLRQPGYIELALPFTAATFDAEKLYQLPSGAYFTPLEFMWRVTTPFTGGSSSAIGVSSSKTGYTTKGDLLGGASGDVAATLVAGSRIPGTIGAKWASIADRRAVWAPGEAFLLDRVTSAFTAGAGVVLVPGILLANVGA